MQTMDELSLHFLQDIYDAEKRALRSMQKMARAASNEQLKDAILSHRQQSEEQVTRLERVFELVTGKRPRGKTCAAMTGLITEVEEAISESEKGPMLDAALIACAQGIDHYEIARYGAMAAWARQAGKQEVADLLQQTLEEEKQSDHGLSELAERIVNPAVPGGDGEPHDDDEEEPEAEAKPAPRRAAPRKKPAPEPEAPPAAPTRARRPTAKPQVAAASATPKPRRTTRK